MTKLDESATAVYVVVSVAGDDIASAWDTRDAARAEAARLSGIAPFAVDYTVERLVVNQSGGPSLRFQAGRWVNR
jgi:hypothetical protein